MWSIEVHVWTRITNTQYIPEKNIFGIILIQFLHLGYRLETVDNNERICSCFVLFCALLVERWGFGESRNAEWESIQS